MSNSEQNKLHNNENSHMAVKAPPDASGIPIEDPIKTEGSPPPDKHHHVDAGDIPRKVSTSASIATKEYVEAEVTEISSDKREEVTCNDSHVKSHTDLAEGNLESSATSKCLKFSNKLKNLSTCFSCGWDKLKQFYNSWRSANGCTILLCAMSLIGYALAFRGWLIILQRCAQHLSELGYATVPAWIIVVITVVCFILAMRIKQLRKYKTILWLIDWISRL